MRTVNRMGHPINIKYFGDKKFILSALCSSPNEAQKERIKLRKRGMYVRVVKGKNFARDSNEWRVYTKDRATKYHNPPLVKMFGGQKYKLLSANNTSTTPFTSKKSARARAEEYRRWGVFRYMRVVPVKDGYVLYARE